MVAYCQPEMDTPKLSDKQSVGKVCTEKWNISIKIGTQAANMLLQIAYQRTCILNC